MVADYARPDGRLEAVSGPGRDGFEKFGVDSMETDVPGFGDAVTDYELGRTWVLRTPELIVKRAWPHDGGDVLEGVWSIAGAGQGL